MARSPLVTAPSHASEASYACLASLSIHSRILRLGGKLGGADHVLPVREGDYGRGPYLGLAAGDASGRVSAAGLLNPPPSGVAPCSRQTAHRCAPLLERAQQARAPTLHPASTPTLPPPPSLPPSILHLPTLHLTIPTRLADVAATATLSQHLHHSDARDCLHLRPVAAGSRQ